jgi:hypothetical protein
MWRIPGHVSMQSSDRSDALVPFDSQIEPGADYRSEVAASVA